MKLRTHDQSYGAEYWNTLDNGAGYQDSLLWSDIGFILHELFGVTEDRDIALEVGIMDVGCAFGFLLRHLRRRGFDVRGIDFSRYALEHAPDDIKDYVSWFDLAQPTPWHDRWGKRSHFELVTCFETLEHIPESSVPQALQHIRRLLAPNGHAVLTICTDRQPDWDSDPTHITIKPRSWWSDRLAEAGLAEIEALAEELRRFWLFSRHDGVFALSESVSSVADRNNETG